MDTIYALSSGLPPAAIAVVRLSGPAALAAVEALAGVRPEPRRATLSILRSNDQAIDNAIVLYFPAPHSQTGEDVAEFHLHGGRAVIAALEEALSSMDGLRHAEPGEFTRRAFENGKIDLTGVEGLADLVMAETESQRRAALLLAGGSLSRQIAGWQEQVLMLSAQVEAVLDLSDEGEVGESLPAAWHDNLAQLVADLDRLLARPPAERLKDGVRVVIAGPPNSGKSSLLNLLSGREAAIISPIPGTTRDVLEAPTIIGGIPFLLTDTAGLRESSDAIEVIGVTRAQQRAADADILLWLGDPPDCPPAREVLIVESKCDLRLCEERNPDAELHVSAVTEEGIDALIAVLGERARRLLPRETETALNARHRGLVGECRHALVEAADAQDPLIIAESLRNALRALDRITGRAGVEDMLDRLFASLCIGK
jgi:tRNA modification GTPase